MDYKVLINESNINNLLNNSNPSVRLAAVESQHFKPEHMAQALNDESWYVRMTARDKLQDFKNQGHQFDNSGIYMGQIEITDEDVFLSRGKGNQALTLTEFNESTGHQDSKCNHELSEYVGFTDSFTFCKKCDKRIDNV